MPWRTRMKIAFLQVLFWLALLGLGCFATSLEPGYLDFDNLPDTNFTCVGKVIGGYYADLETSCQMFHVCTIGQHNEPMDIRFLCLNGTVFDQETRVCERIDEVDCSKSEQFYNLNLELYGNTQPPILEESAETEPPIAKYSSPKPPSTTQRIPKTTRHPTLSSSIAPSVVTARPTPSKVVSSHHFPVSNSPDIRFNPSEINISLNPGSLPEIRTKPVSYQQQSYNSDSSKVIVTTHTIDFKSEADKHVPLASALQGSKKKLSAATTPKNQQYKPTAGDASYEYTYKDAEYDTELPKRTYNEPSYRTSTYRNNYQSSSKRNYPLKSTTYRSPVYSSSIKPLSRYSYHRTEKPHKDQIPLPLIPTLPPLTFSSPAPFSLSRHIETKRFTNEHQAPRIIISASASVSDASGRRLNYSLGTIGTAQLYDPPPTSYDEYKEEDVELDPFYHDVPKIKGERKKRSTKINPSDVIKSEQEAVDILKFLFEWYTNQEKTTKVSIPLESDLITEINDELSPTESPALQDNRIPKEFDEVEAENVTDYKDLLQGDHSNVAQDYVDDNYEPFTYEISGLKKLNKTQELDSEFDSSFDSNQYQEPTTSTEKTIAKSSEQKTPVKSYSVRRRGSYTFERVMSTESYDTSTELPATTSNEKATEQLDDDLTALTSVQHKKDIDSSSASTDSSLEEETSTLKSLFTFKFDERGEENTEESSRGTDSYENFVSTILQPPSPTSHEDFSDLYHSTLFDHHTSDEFHTHSHESTESPTTKKLTVEEEIRLRSERLMKELGIRYEEPRIKEPEPTQPRRSRGRKKFLPADSNESSSTQSSLYDKVRKEFKAPTSTEDFSWKSDSTESYFSNPTKTTLFDEFEELRKKLREKLTSTTNYWATDLGSVESTQSTFESDEAPTTLFQSFETTPHEDNDIGEYKISISNASITNVSFDAGPPKVVEKQLLRVGKKKGSKLQIKEFVHQTEYDMVGDTSSASVSEEDTTEATTSTEITTQSLLDWINNVKTERQTTLSSAEGVRSKATLEVAYPSTRGYHQASEPSTLKSTDDHLTSVEITTPSTTTTTESVDDRRWRRPLRSRRRKPTTASTTTTTTETPTTQTTTTTEETFQTNLVSSTINEEATTTSYNEVSTIVPKDFEQLQRFVQSIAITTNSIPIDSVVSTTASEGTTVATTTTNLSVEDATSHVPTTTTTTPTTTTPTTKRARTQTNRRRTSGMRFSSRYRSSSSEKPATDDGVPSNVIEVSSVSKPMEEGAVTDAYVSKSVNPTLAKKTKDITTTTPLYSSSVRANKNFIFNCFDKEINKFYSDPRDCRLFHYCTAGFTRNQLLDMKFVCDLGTYYDDEMRVCTKDKPTRCL